MTSIGSRLTLWYVLIITGTVAAVLLTGRILLEMELIHGIDLLNAAESEEIRDRTSQAGQDLPREALLKQISDHSKIDAPLYFFQVRDDKEIVLFRSENMAQAVFPENPPDHRNWTIRDDKLGDLRISTFTLGRYELQIATSVRVIQKLFLDYYQVSAGLLAAVVLLSFYLGHRMSRLALDPLRFIQKAASRISAQNLKERIPIPKAQDEIYNLAKLLNEMFDLLEVAFARLSRFAGEASHELKTPLSIMRLQSEKLLLQGNLSPSQQEAVQQQLESIQALYLVIEKLLFIARSDAGGIRLNTKLQGTQEFMETFADDARVLCEDRQVEFQIARNDDLSLNFDASLIRQVLLNLLSNALKVTPAGQAITLSSFESSDARRVMVEDTGPGISDTFHGEEIFKPFVRISPDLDWSLAGGTGLGLAICRSIVQLHSIQVENRRPEKGLRVIFQIPMSAEIAPRKSHLLAGATPTLLGIF
jgi:signal transduction histidine kinase